MIQRLILLGNRLIQKLIAQDYRLLCITLCNHPPDSAILVHIFLALEQTRIAVAVIYVCCSALSSRSHVHIQNQIQTHFLAHLHHIVYVGEASFRIVVTQVERIIEKSVCQRQANGIGGNGIEIYKVLVTDVVLQKALPPPVHILVSENLPESLVNLRNGNIGESETVSFRGQPMVQIHSLDGELGAVSLAQSPS